MSIVARSAPPVSSVGTICSTVIARRGGLDGMGRFPHLEGVRRAESNRMSEPQLEHLSRRRAGRTRARSPPSCAAGKAPGIFWLGGFRSDMQGTKAEALDLWAGEHGRAADALRLFRPWQLRRPLRGRHHLALAGGGGGGLRRFHRRAAGARRLVDGRLAGAAPCEAPRRARRRRPAARDGAARPGGRHDQGPDVGPLEPGEAAQAEEAGLHRPSLRPIRRSPTSSRAR